MTTSNTPPGSFGQLTSAIEQLTTPVAGLDRRSVLVVRAQLIA